MLGFNAVAVFPIAGFGRSFTASAVSPSSGRIVMDIYVKLILNSFTIDEVVGGGPTPEVEAFTFDSTTTTFDSTTVSWDAA